jgi:ribonucleoside-diphosphate reductase alpha chain
MHKTKWPQGWTWLDTYNTNTDELITTELQYDWNTLSAEVVANKGIRFSSLINLMPGESSSKATGSPNSVYLVRALTKSKSDENNIVEWVAPQPKDDFAVYELAYDTPMEDHINMYALYQKWADQAISADFYMDRSTNFDVSEKTILGIYARMVKYGIKGTYYMNTESINDESIGCGSGGCTL